MNYGERLKLLREKKGLTQKEVAKMINTSQSYLSQYETNPEIQIPFDRVVKLAEIYDTSLDYIAGFTEDINRKRK